MQKLIPIDQSSIENEQVQTVDARQLHRFLDSKQQFGNWINNKVIDDKFFTEGVDFIPLSNFIKQRGTGGIS